MIVLICPTNSLYMPYCDNYLKVLNANNVKYDIIYWDRFDLNDFSTAYRYFDKVTGHKKTFKDYYLFSHYIKALLKKNNYNKIIVFGLQIAFFLQKQLFTNYKENFILDIRDRNPIISFMNIKKVINNSCHTVLSSPGYLEWLPNSEKYLVNHNTNVSLFPENDKALEINQDKKIIISNIGATRDLKINLKLINALRNSSKFELRYHGYGDINEKIINYTEKEKISNVVLTGKYNKNEESSFYENTDIVNLLVDNESINSRTLLPNRLYNSLIHFKPGLININTYLSKTITKYNLGLVINSFSDLEQQILNYIDQFDYTSFQNSRKEFLTSVLNDNHIFEEKISVFFKNS